MATHHLGEEERVLPPPDIAAALAKHAVVSDRAVLVGNRAGLVAWANASWTRITGFPLEATLHKPIAHFLGEADIEIGLVDFVGQRFLEGRPCTIEFPFETFDERSIWVHLEVQPICNAVGEIVEFVAIATDETERRAKDLAAEAQRRRRSDRAESAAGEPTHPLHREDAEPCPERGDRLVLEEAIERVCARFIQGARATTSFDLALDPTGRTTDCNPLLLGELIAQLVESAMEGVGEEWGTVTVISGRTERGRGHLSQAYPIPFRSPELGRAAWHFVEVHDSGQPLEQGDLRVATRGAAGRDPRARRLAVASELARLLGGSLHLGSIPGCGTQALLLLPIMD